MEQITIQTSKRCEFVNITAHVTGYVRDYGVQNAAVVVFVPHTTAGVTINENADPDVTTDLLQILETLVPTSSSYQHSEGNSDAHAKASLMGSSVTVLVDDGRVQLGTWQGIYFAEFDGPRTRKVYMQILASGESV